jgi:predicted aspartyl protease
MEKNKMGRFTIEFEIANNRDLGNSLTGHLDSAKVRRKTIQGVVDSGATRLVLPLAVATELGLPIKKKKVKVRYADGRRSLRTEVEEVRLYLLGRDGIFSAVVEPKRDTALIGAIVLEELDFLVDCTKGRLVPRDPDYVVSEIEDSNHQSKEELLEKSSRFVRATLFDVRDTEELIRKHRKKKK